MKLFSLFFALLYCSLGSVSAEEVRIHGLTLKCDRCSNLEDRICSISGQSEISCNDALKILLVRTLEDYKGERPAPAELRQFLLKKDWNGEIAKPALELLSITKSGQTSISTEMPRYYHMYQREIFELLLEDKFPKILQLRMWKLEERDGIKLDPRLRALIAAKSLRVSLGTLLNSIESVKPKKVIKELEEFSRIISKVRPEWSPYIQDTIKWMKRCGYGRAVIEDPQNCSISSIVGRAPDVENFLSSYNLRLNMRYIKRNNSNPEEVASLLSASYIEGSYSPELADVLSDAVRAALNDPDENQLRSFTQAAALKMLFSVSEKSNEVAQLVGIILNKVSRRYLKQGKFYEALSVIEGSYDTFPLALRERTDLLADLLSRKEARKDVKARERINVLRKRDRILSVEREKLEREAQAQKREEAKPSSDSSSSGHRKIVIMYLVMTFSLVYLVGFLLRTKLPPPLGALFGLKMRKALAGFEQKELERLLSDFGLAPNAPIGELTACFRALEKEFDPQYGVAKVKNKKAKMRELKAKYEKTRSLMLRR